MDFRPIPDDRTGQYQEYLHDAFRPEEGPQDEYDWSVEEQPGHPRGLFDDGEMVCACRHYWFRTHLRGREFEMPGLAAVATPPEHRRQGYAARLLAESLAEYRDRGDFLTALWAFDHPFYERRGWRLANKWVRYECDPAVLHFARAHASGDFRRVEADEYDRLVPVLAADHADYELRIDRTEEWWRERVFSGWRGDRYVYGWESADGELRGFVVYRVVDGDDEEGKRLVADEVAAADHEAYLNLLRFLANHESQVERVSINSPYDASLLDLTDDPADVECEVESGPMVRLVDVPAAIEALDYPDVADAEFTVAVSDPLVDWNAGTFRVALDGGRATCERTTDDAGSAADVTAGVGALSQVYVGYHSVADAETLADLDVDDPGASETLSAMFPERDVFLREGF